MGHGRNTAFAAPRTPFDIQNARLASSRYASRNSANPGGEPATTSPSMRAPSSAKSARPELSTSLTACRSKRRAPASNGCACVQTAATAARVSAPRKLTVSSLRVTVAVDIVGSVGGGVGLQFAGLDVGGHLRDRLL